MTPPLLSCRGLSVGYGDAAHALLKNIDLAIHARELICFMGPNGIGKSTLIRTLSGLQKELSGKVSVAREQISVVLTDKITATNLTVFDLVAYGRYPYLDWTLRMDDQDLHKVNESLDMVKVRHLEDRRLFELSDGQLQMVMIARALAQDTPLILLDEPTAHLDLNNRVEVMNLLKELSRNLNKGILVATHELDLALQMADRIWLANLEHEIISGIPEDLVLDGSFDNVFRFKGFDLRSGKVQHKPYRNTTIQLKGPGQELLWTRNALERSGYSVQDNGAVKIEVVTRNGLSWAIGEKTFPSIAILLDQLEKLS